MIILRFDRWLSPFIIKWSNYWRKDCHRSVAVAIHKTWAITPKHQQQKVWGLMCTLITCISNNTALPFMSVCYSNLKTIRPLFEFPHNYNIIHTVVFYCIHWNFYDVGNFRVYGPFPLESTNYQWWVDSNSLKYNMKKAVSFGCIVQIKQYM